MACMKCGRETKTSHAFCDDCLAEMVLHPVRQDAVVNLPVRPATSDRPSSRSRDRSPSETIRGLQKMVRWLTAIIAILTVLLCATAGFLIHTLEEQAKADMIGRNYSTDSSITAP